MYKIPPKYTNVHLTNLVLSSIIHSKAKTKDTKAIRLFKREALPPAESVLKIPPCFTTLKAAKR